MSDLTPVVERAADSFSDAERTAARVRSIASRLPLCNEGELVMFEVLLTQLEHERDGSAQPPAEVLQLRNDRFNEAEGSGLRTLGYRRGWNDSSRYAEVKFRIEHGLVELRRQSQWPVEERFDLGGESGEG